MSNAERVVDQCVYATYSTGMIAAKFVCLREDEYVDDLKLMEYQQELSKRGIKSDLLTDEGFKENNFQTWWEKQLAMQGNLH